MKKWMTLLLTLIMLSGAAAQATSLVRFDGEEKGFTFVTSGSFSAEDLFVGFKSVMPGDVITQRIVVRNASSKEMRIYLRAEPVDERHKEFLSRINLQVSTRDGQIFDAAASETGQLTENTLLGTFRRSGTTQLALTLTVPYDLGNDYMLATGVIPWTFVAEEVIEDDTPHTGDSFDLGVWLLAAGMILLAIGWVLLQMKRQRAEMAE